MVEIIVAAIGTLGLMGAAYITANMAAKLRGAEGRTESTNEQLWQIIDGLRTDVERLHTDIARLTTDNDKLRLENDHLKAGE